MPPPQWLSSQHPLMDCLLPMVVTVMVVWDIFTKSNRISPTVRCS
ncbi:hypothetical protein L798_15119 [Zootermopsis nevadensis]|uniref:Uncharacterized protein n=1 Tax=Zootermopsis nevadensis TaxID=136037 RepID=A0A067R0I4_ZOONE|nr:hypothetical protein L798_15119 [Zootermopsis nevadensis]